MESYLYNCHYCNKTYKPNRRKKQKYCSSSCRSRAFTLRNTKLVPATTVIENEQNEQNAKIKIDKISMAGVGNAAIGTLAVNVVSNLLTSEGNKPATKNDIQNLTTILKNRYHPISNIPIRSDGTKAFYDFQTQTIVYLKTLMK